MKLKFICTLIAICILFSLSSCGSVENTFDIYHGYEVRVISPEGYDAIQIISLYNANDFESMDSYSTNNSYPNVIMKVKTSKKTAYKHRGEPTESEAISKYTSPYIMLTDATVTELYHVSDAFEYDICVGDNVWLANEYVVDNENKMIFLAATPLNEKFSYETLILPDSEYLLFASPQIFHGKHEYKGNLIFESIPQGTVPLNYTTWEDYAHIIAKNGFPTNISYSHMWDAAIDKYIK